MSKLNLKKQPIQEFKTKSEAIKCLKEWQKRLFLEDWIIKIHMCSPDEFYNKNVCGEFEFQMVNKCGVVRILKPEFYEERIVKYCAERILVHELLHGKYNWLENNNSTYESAYFNTIEHSLIEEMAKSLIMAKYNINFNWFANF